MKTKITKGLLALLICSTAQPLSAQDGLHRILEQVETNNQALAARRKLTDAKAIESRVGNSLDDPEVEYEHGWGNRSDLGHNGELRLVQKFDFPTVYAHRNKLSQIRSAQYSYEYEAFRKEVLLEAKLLYIEITALREQADYLMSSVNDAARISRLMSQRVEAGDANVLDENKAKFELASMRYEYGQIQLELKAAESRLANLNGGTPVIIEDTRLLVDFSLPPLTEIMELYENAAPELLAVFNEKTAAEREVRLSKSQSIPKMAVGYKMEYATGERFNGIVVGMSIPLFGNRNNVKRAKAEAVYAQAEYHRAKVDIMTNLEKLYGEAQLLEATLQELDGLSHYSEALQLLDKALTEGHISVTQYYSERNPIHRSRVEMTAVKREFLSTRAQIEMIYL